MRGRHVVHVVNFAVGGFAAMKLLAIPGGNALFAIPFRRIDGVIPFVADFIRVADFALSRNGRRMIRRRFVEGPLGDMGAQRHAGTGGYRNGGKGQKAKA